MNNIVEMYKNGYTIHEIANSFLMDDDEVLCVLKEENKYLFRIGFTEAGLYRISEKYKNGERLYSLGEAYHVDRHLLSSLLQTTGVKLRNESQSRQRYSIKEDYWDDIDTQNKAYFLGFLFADGNNSSSKNTIRLSLKEDDREILEKLRIEIGSNRPLRFLSSEQKRQKDVGYNYKDQYALEVFNKHWCERLTELGCVPNKSLILRFPNYLDENLIPHFIRGYFDGDGCIVNLSNGGHNINLTSTKDFCVAIQEVVLQTLGIKSYLYPASNNNGITTVWELRKKDDIKTFLDWIYQDAELYLERKHDLYIQKYC